MYCKDKSCKGITLPELLGSVTIVSVILAIGVPSFKDTLAGNRLTITSNELLTLFWYARSEAVKRGMQVTVRHKGELESVWDQGLDIFTDENGDGVMNGSDEHLKTYASVPAGFTVRTGSNFASWLAYTADGGNRGQKLSNDTFRVCDSTKDTKNSRSLISNRTGRVRIQVTTTVCP